MRPVLVLTGPPAIGKSSTARAVAARRPRCAVIDVDDLRHLVVSGHIAPWQGAEGAAQRRLGVRNACGLASNFVAQGIEVVIADLLTPETGNLYRELLPGCLVVRLTAPLTETWRRSATRQRWLTDAEFESLYRQAESAPPRTQVTIDVSALDRDRQTEAVEHAWQGETV